MPAAREVSVQLTVNGAPRAATVPARTLLVHFLRDQLRLTGTHVGCDTTQCGACTVALDGVAVKSCTVLAAQADGHEVTTIEGLGRPRHGGALAPRAAGLPGRARPPVRLLHPGHGDGRPPAPRRPAKPNRGRGQARAVRQHLPLHGLPEHSRGRPPRRQPRGITARNVSRRLRLRPRPLPRRSPRPAGRGGRGRRGGQAHRGRPVAPAHDEAPPRRSPGPHRHRRPQGTQARRLPRSQPHHRRPHHLPAASPAAARRPRRDARPRQRGHEPRRRGSRPSRTPSRSWPTRRSAPGARSAARWRTATRPPTSRRSCWPWTRRSPSPPARAGTSTSPAPRALARPGAPERASPRTSERQTMLLDDFLQGIYTTDLAEDEIITHVSDHHPGRPGQRLREVPAPGEPPSAGGRRAPASAGTLTDETAASLVRRQHRPRRDRRNGNLSPPLPCPRGRSRPQGRLPTADTLAAAAAQVTRTLDGTELQPARRPARQRPVPRPPGRGPHPPRPGRHARADAVAATHGRATSTASSATMRGRRLVSLIGQPLTRREDPPLLTGRGQYVDDFAPEGTLHAFVVRSPLAHARITSVDVEEARQAEGVHAVFTAEDLAAQGVGPLPGGEGLPPGSLNPPFPALASDKVLWAGQPVALVVADTTGTRRRRRRARRHRLRRPPRGHRRPRRRGRRRAAAARRRAEQHRLPQAPHRGRRETPRSKTPPTRSASG